MKITAVSVQNFKRIVDVRIAPDADRALVLIGGNNANGKSSTLDALTTAFGGKKTQPADPVRRGAEEANIRVELDGGELTVHRIIQPDGESHLEVRDRMGARKAPQQMLDTLVGSRFLDPLSYLALPAKEQRAQLMRLIPEADRIAELNEKRERAFSKRTEVGRDKSKAEGELGRLEERQVATPIDVAELTANAKQLDEQHDQVVAARSALDAAAAAMAARERELGACKRLVAMGEQRVADLEAQLAGAREELERNRSTAQLSEADLNAAHDTKVAAKTNVESAEAAWEQVRSLRDAIDADLRRADEHNRKVFADEAHNKRRAETAETVRALSDEYEKITKVLAVIDQRKAEILANAKLPVDGLGIDDVGITLNGVSFEQASRAEQLRVALGLAIAASPKLADIWVRDGAVLDDESLAALEQQAAATGHRLWIERVGTRDPGVIVIRDGQVAS